MKHDSTDHRASKHARGRIRFEATELCATCLSCMTACSLHTSGAISLDCARIRIDFDPFTGIHSARFCRHCDDPHCREACPTGAITKDQATGIVSIRAELCNQCLECIEACPFEAIFWDSGAEKVIKCELCAEDPPCVAACRFGVLTYE